MDSRRVDVGISGYGLIHGEVLHKVLLFRYLDIDCNELGLLSGCTYSVPGLISGYT